MKEEYKNLLRVTREILRIKSGEVIDTRSKSPNDMVRRDRLVKSKRPWNSNRLNCNNRKRKNK